jgi:hypothetical protein
MTGISKSSVIKLKDHRRTREQFSSIDRSLANGPIFG